jgi:RNA polymerase sigma-70 factor (ECF subfamily)
MTHDPDEWLMSKVARGRHEALEPLIRRYANPLLTFIRRMVGDHHRSEDLFQDVFVAVWTRRKKYDAGRAFKPWLYAIALNTCRAEFRRRGAIVAMDDLDELVSRDNLDPPAEIALATEQATLVAAAMKQLPFKQRAVVALRVWSGLSYGEIADALGRDVGTIRSNMHHGLAALRTFLEPRMR